MLFHYFPKNETPPPSYPLQFHALRPSASSDDIFSKQRLSPFKPRFFSELPLIYENIKINRTPSINQLKREIISTSRQARYERLQMVNSIHKSTLRDALFQTKSPYSTLLITASYDGNNTYTKRNNDNKKIQFMLNNSSMQDTNNSVDNENKVDMHLYQTFVNDVKKQKMSLQIGSLFALSTSNPSSLSKRCVRFSVIEGLANANKKRLLQMKEDYHNKINEINNIEFRLLYNKKLLEKGYGNTFNEYLAFLKSQITSEAEKLETYVDAKRHLEIQVSKLKMEVNRLNKSIWKLRELRNFIIFVKEKKAYNSDLITAIENNTVNKGRWVSQEQIQRYTTYLNPLMPIFKSTDEFISCYTELEQKGMLLLIENEKKATSVQIMKDYLIDLAVEGEKQERIITQQIHQKQKVLDIRKSIYFQLLKQRNSLDAYTIKPLSQVDVHSVTSRQTRKSSVSGSVDKETLIALKYKDRMKRYPVSFAILYIDLVKQIKLLISLNVINEDDIVDVGLLKSQVDLIKLFNVKLTSKNQHVVSSACIMLLKIYERAIIFIYEKHNEYVANPLLKEDIVRVTLQHQSSLKIKNAEEQRKLIAQQRKLEVSKVMKKMSKTIVTTNRKVPEKLYLIQSVRRKATKKKKETQREELHFEDFVTLENDDM